MATPTVAGSSLKATVQVENNENWMRLSLTINLHGTEGMKDIIYSISIFFKDKKKIHIWLANSRKNKKCIIQKFIWEKLLGDCNVLLLAVEKPILIS